MTQQEVAYDFVALVMGLVNGMNLPDRPVVVLVNALLLLTMLVLDVCRDQRHEVRDSGTHVLVESKSGTRAGSVADRMLRTLGVQPTSVTKYAVAVAALHPELPSNPWHQTLRRYFTPLQTAV